MSPLPVPKGNQHKVIYLRSDRHNVVLGTAGTGKSTMAMLRALHLARATTENHGPVLVVTYNNTLVTYLRYLSTASSSEVTVETYGKFARGYLNAVGLMKWNAIADPDKVRTLVHRAVVTIQQVGGQSGILDRDIDWIIDEIHWISGMGLQTEAAYQAVERVGRQTPLPTGAARTAIWAVREAYRQSRGSGGFPYDWYDIASSVKNALAVDPNERKYRHIIIDEGQDLSPEAIRSLTHAVQDGGSLTFFGDYHQAIYGQGLSWRASGINLGNRPVNRFVDNLRNTGEIAKVAIAMARSPYMNSGDIDLVMPTQPAAAGPMPSLVRCADAQEEASYLRNLAEVVSQDRSVAILARTWSDAQRVAGSLPSIALSPNMTIWDGKPGLYIGAYHSAKGLEFDAVLMPFLRDDTIPLPDVLDAFDTDEACAREARLLYVSLTRARDTLVMSYSGLLTRLLPANDGLWIEEQP